MQNKVIIASLFSVLTLGSAQADQGGKWSAGVNISTLGAGVNAAYKFNNFFKVRGTFNYFQLNRKVNGGEFDIDGRLRLLTVGLLGDLHLFENGFRLTGGIVYNGNRLKAKSTLSRNFTIHGRTYTPQQIGEVDGSLDFRPIAPYIGIGYDSGHTQQAGLSFAADVGVLFQGKVRGKINSISGLLANNPQTISDVKDEIVDEVNKKTIIKAYPVVSLGLNYRF